MDKWKPFPQNKPKDGLYLVTIMGFGTRIVKEAVYKESRDYQWEDEHGVIASDSVLAFMDVPTPYIEKE